MQNEKTLTRGLSGAKPWGSRDNNTWVPVMYLAEFLQEGIGCFSHAFQDCHVPSRMLFSVWEDQESYMFASPGSSIYILPLGCCRVLQDGKRGHGKGKLSAVYDDDFGSKPHQPNQKKKSVRVHWTHIPYPEQLRYFSFSSRMSNSRAGPSECWCVAGRVVYGTKIYISSLLFLQCKLQRVKLNLGKSFDLVVLMQKAQL